MKQSFNIFFISESMSAPEWVDFAENIADARTLMHSLRKDADIAEDSDDTFFCKAASFYG